MIRTIQLEPEARKLAEETSKPPYLFQLGPEKGREAVDETQSVPAATPVPQPIAQVEEFILDTGENGRVGLRIVRPKEAKGTLPVVLYLHGAGWVFGNAHTHDRLVRELANGSGAAVVFPSYSLSPEARYPKALEEIYSVLEWIERAGETRGFDSSRIAVAGDSVGGNMTAALALMAKERGGPAIAGQLMFYPVTDASFDTESYREFAEGYYLRRDAMMWFWDQYLPDRERRGEITASPLRATTGQLRGLPPALVITAEADVLCDEGEAYAEKLKQAGVETASVRYPAIIHDFVMLNSLSGTQAARSAIELAGSWLREKLG
ncbi:alpha/beta hydrolase [Cohnella fermenti]|uniref:Alpha/beta hydrolase n=1 Tax=Cohnella fermenti TaxID=2565925 RepID=A0A4S4CAT1_9BACL|nr:alpha/beta hydrolase [Cohnella fermenti]THF84568.1 alpha/beta hydrolase [Cohnella fermenti]